MGPVDVRPMVAADYMGPKVKGGRSLVFWVPDGTTKYRRLTKDRGEAPKKGKVGYLPTKSG